jgi:ABC-type uncharacterized transport system involved in gliding motility auxiliary subunit
MSSATRTSFGRLGLLALGVLFVVAVSLANVVLRGARLDLTENRLYTLSSGTTKVLGDIAEPVNLYFFYSDKATTDVPYLRAYASRVRDLLREFVQHSNGKLKLKEVDPIPFSDEEDRATQFGLRGVKLDNAADPVYLGIAGTNSTGEEQTLGFLDPAKEPFLEYDLAKMVYTLAHPKKHVVALLSGLPINAGFDPQTQQIRQPWVVVEQLRQFFVVTPLERGTTTIGKDTDVLMVVHPKQLPDTTLYAIDQFILHGGRTLLFVDPYSEVDTSGANPADPTSQFTANKSSSLNKLIEAWGISVPADKFVGDDRYALQVMGPNQRPVRDIGLIGVDQSGLDSTDVITSGMNVLNFGFPGYIEMKDKAAATVAPLVRSSEAAAPISAASLGFMSDPEMLRDNFQATGKRYVLAARVGGKVPSAFPGGPPAGAATGTAHLAAAEKPINVVLVADTDLLSDRLWVQSQNFFGQRMNQAFANNGDFVVNAIDNLAGSSDLIGIRARASFNKPFTRVQELRRGADTKFRVTEKRLQQELRETEQKLGEIQSRRSDRNNAILTPDQEKEIARFQEQRITIRRELRQVQRDLDRDIEGLGTRLKIINIALMPAVISALTLLYAWWRRRRAPEVKVS